MAPCCAPGCRSNYKPSEEEYVPSFKFPSDKELRQQWIILVPRQNWKCTKNSVLCVKHFRVEDIIDCVIYTDQDGSTKSVKSEKTTLKKGALPAIWPGMPAFLTEAECKKRKSLAENLTTEICHAADAEVEEFLESDAIKGYNDFAANYKSKLSNALSQHWTITSNSNCIVFFTLNIEQIPKVQTSIKVDSDLSVRVFLEQTHCKQISRLVPNGKLKHWFQLENLLSIYSNIETTQAVTRVKRKRLSAKKV